MKYKEIPEYESIGFEGMERFLSNRGYIWSRSIPILKDTVFLGVGADNYAFYFPQDDFVGKMNVFGNYKIVVDKPHNMYLQLGINFGLVFLLIFLGFIVYLITQIGRLVLKKHNYIEGSEYLIVTFGAVAVGYLVAGVFNDSVVGVSQIFWTFLAMILALTVQCEVTE